MIAPQLRAFRLAITLLAIVGPIAGCASSTGPTPSAPTSSFPPATIGAINSAITAWFSEYNAPGAIVGIWIPSKGTYVAARGKADLASGEAMQTDDHMRIGSITKTFTVTVLLQLVDKERVRLDDPVSKYLSYIPNGQHITLRMLANMTAGLFNYTADKRFERAFLQNPQRIWTPRQLVNVSLRHRPDFPPGTGWNYSNTNTVVLGIIIEQVTGKSMLDVFKEESFQPLGLTNTIWPTTSALPLPYAHGITDQTLNGKEADGTHWNPSWAFTAGKIISNLQDLKTWAKAVATGAQISPALQKQRLTWVKFPPLTPEKTYGLGIVYNHGWLGHEGSLPGYNSDAYYLPSQDATMILLVNSDIGTNNRSPVSALFHALTEIVTPSNVPDQLVDMTQ
jgi:D-alanyl-D-alanine carboxypeptidase